MRVCVIGNSHVAALREASRGNPMLGRHHIDFHAVPGGRQPELSLVADRLRPAFVGAHGVVTTVAGADTEGLRVADYDAVAISACGMGAPRNKHIATNPLHHPCYFLACSHWLDTCRELPQATRLVSQAVFQAVVESYVRAHASMRFASLLAERFHGAVLLQPWPAPSRTVQQDETWFVNAWYGDAEPVWHDYFDAQRLALHNAARELGPRFVFLDYPLPEIKNEGFMDARWCIHDPWHANETYGALVLDQIERALDLLDPP